MGLHVNHDAFSGAYSAFCSFRGCVARAAGGSYCPHWIRNADGTLAMDVYGAPVVDKNKDPNRWYWDGDKYSQETHPGLYAFLCHPDDSGSIHPTMCRKIANELDALLPEIEKLDDGGCGHIKQAGGYVAVTKKFIAGCRDAHKKRQKLLFG